MAQKIPTAAATSWLLALLFFMLTAGVQDTLAAEDNIDHLISNGGYMIEDSSGRHRYRADDLFVPASTMKVLTSLIALELLSPEYRFETHFFLDSQANLYIKGYGDPLLTSANILEIGKKLAGMGITKLRSLCLDDSVFSLNGETASDENSANSYDAPNGALAVNFNAVPILVGKNGKVSSAEPETPLLPLMKQIGSGLAPGSYRLNINMLPPEADKSPTLRYAGELLTAQLQKAGITIQHPFKKENTPGSLKPVFIHQSPAPLEEIVRECLKYSNNFIANQLFLTCGLQAYGFPATWDKGRQTFGNYAMTSLGLPKEVLIVMDGAGLSRQNRVSPAALIQILGRFKPFATLLKQYESIPLKSGTLTGVYCYAGYFPQNDTLIPFALLLNQPENTRKQLLKELQARVPIGDTGIPLARLDKR
ncbi:MAG: D-alanyl-D-alanine carboxypeptidase [Desulforhopalus sp.]|nr:D-alanyl-D-alanine carboxypeptidase [Desulforhopalus sp.]